VLHSSTPEFLIFPNSGAIAIVAISLFVWLFLLLFWGRFWQATERLDAPADFPGDSSNNFPADSPADIIAVVPARNEAALLTDTLRSLLSQRYAGHLRVLLVDDGSTDGTADRARQVAASLPGVAIVDFGSSAARRSNSGDTTAIEFATISPPPLPAGWTGKLWALDRGIAAARDFWGDPDYIWLTDADILHAPDTLDRLVDRARRDRRELVSLMVRLRCESFWERLMVPAFVFFFQKLYPFPWVNDPRRSMAAAAGGCIVLATAALDRIGGLGCVRQALIDDCALARAVKHAPSNTPDTPDTPDPIGPTDRDAPYRRIWLGLSTETRSLRPYDTLASLWEMVARTAYTQLDYSPLLLLGTIAGMAVVYLVPPVSAIVGLGLGRADLATIGGLAWLAMVVAYRPTLRSYQQPAVLGLALPAIAAIYLLATIDSAWRHWRGRGGAWKGRTYARTPPAP